MSSRQNIQAEIEWHQIRIKELMGELEKCVDKDNTNVVCLTIAERIPAEMFFQIFKYFDCRILKNCRLTCRTWRDAIDNNSKLIKSFTFDIFDARTFLESTLPTKVKSIRFRQPLQNSEECLEEFFAKIGTTVEEIYIGFAKDNYLSEELQTRKDRKKLMFRMLLQYCTKLKTLILTNYGMDFVTEYHKFEVTLFGIQRLLVNASKQHSLILFRDFILNLPNLSFIEFYSDEEADLEVHQIVHDIVLEHLEKYNGNLKEIALDELNPANDKVFIKLFLTIGKLYPNTIIKRQAVLNALLDYQETEQLPFNEDTCKQIQTGLIVIGLLGESELGILDTSRFRYCTNLCSLKILVARYSETELNFIEDLKKLTYLKLWSSSYDLEPPPYLVHEFLSFAIPSLDTLELQGPQFQLNSLLFHTCFPNITKMILRQLTLELRDDFICVLTKLDFLESLTLEQMENITDGHLTYRDNDNNSLEQPKAENIPATASFKSLKQLYLGLCRNLTDICLLNGLKFCDKLRKITLCFNLHQFTIHALDCLQLARNYHVELLPASHALEECDYYGELGPNGDHKQDLSLRHRRFILQ